MTIRAVPIADHPLPADVVLRAEQVLDVLRDLRDHDADGGGSAGPELDEGIREFSRVADRLRAQRDAVPVAGMSDSDSIVRGLDVAYREG